MVLESREEVNNAPTSLVGSSSRHPCIDSVEHVVVQVEVAMSHAWIAMVVVVIPAWTGSNGDFDMVGMASASANAAMMTWCCF